LLQATVTFEEVQLSLDCTVGVPYLKQMS